MSAVEENTKALLERIAKKVEGRPSAKWRGPGDVDWEDLEFYIQQCKTRQDKDSFDTAIRVLEALKTQVLDR